MISPTAEYALRAIVYLASKQGEPQTNQQIAEITKVPSAYLSKVLQALGRAGLLTSQRGLGGGYRLTRDMDEITMLDVVNSVDPVQRIRRCPMEIAEHGFTLCPLHSRLDKAMEFIETTFGDTTVGSLVRAPVGDESCRGPIPLGLTPVGGRVGGQPATNPVSDESNV